MIYTGDTGFHGMSEVYENIKKEYANKKIALIANIGGFKRAKVSYKKNNNIENCYYFNHLGRIGLAKLVEVLQPDLCIISEFG